MQRNANVVAPVSCAAFRLRATLRVLALWLVSSAGVNAQAGVQLMAPTTDAPSTVAAGELWTFRVALATALTPPPGVQQARALRDWSIELSGNARGLAQPIVHRYELPVANVRPETGSSLVYRVQALLPRWMAPGRYDMSLVAPGGRVDAMRVLHVPGHGDGRVQQTGEWIGLRAETERLAQLPSGVALRWFPGTTLASRTTAPSVVAFVPGDIPLPARAVASVTSSLQVRVGVEPPARAGHASQLIVRDVPAAARVFWSLPDGSHHADVTRVRHVFRASGVEHVHLLVVASDGSASRVDAELRVLPGQRFGCQLATALDTSADAPPTWSWAPLILALALLKRRPRMTRGID